MEEQIRTREAGIVHLIALVMIAIAIVVGVYLVQQQTNLKSKATLTGVALSLQPEQINLNTNQEVTVTVFADAGSYQVAGADINISFDPAQVEVRSIQASTTLPVVLSPGAVAGSTASISMGATPDHLFTGTGAIATLVIVPKNTLTSSTTLQLTNQTIVVAINHTDNVVGALHPATVTRISSAASITASPNPVPGSGGQTANTTISWNTANSQNGQVWVAENGGAEVVFASGVPSGSQEAPWIQVGHTYVFKLYGSTHTTPELASITVTRPGDLSTTDSDSDGDPDSTDCGPNDSSAHHGQTRFFTDSYIKANGSSSFDYDCNGVETKKYGLTTLPHSTGTIYSRGPGDWCEATRPSGVQGFIGTVPACGSSGEFRRCAVFSENNCGGTSTMSETTCETQVGSAGPAVSWVVADGTERLPSGLIVGGIQQSCN